MDRLPPVLRLSLLTLAVLTPVLAFPAMTTLLHERAQQTNIEDRLRSNAAAAVDDIDRAVIQQLTALATLATSRDLDNDDIVAFAESAQRVLQTQSDWLTIALNGPTGQVLNLRHALGPGLLPPYDREGRDLVFQTGKPRVGGILFAPERHPEPFVLLQVPVERYGKVTYVLAAAVRTATFTQILRSQNPTSGWYTALADHDNRLIARTPDDNDFVGTPWTPEFINGIARSGDQVVRLVNLKGEEAYTAFSRSDLTGWTVGPGAPVALVERPLRWARVVVGVSGTAAVILALVLAGVLIRSAGRQRAAERRRADEEKYRIIFDTADNPIIVIDENGTIQAFNHAAEAAFGHKAAEVIGQDVCILMPEPDRSRHNDYLAHYRRTGERHIIGVGREVTGQRKDGSTFPLDLFIGEWQFEGRRHFTGILRDISARKIVEAALRAAKEEAERASLAKSRFLAAASHDLRQPLNAMGLFLGVLRPRLRDPQAGVIVDRIQESLDAMIGLFNALLDLSKLDAGAIRPAPTAVAVGDLLRRLAVDFAGMAQAKGLELRILPCRARVWTDIALLERILRNLVANAVRHTPSGRVLVGCRHRGQGLRIDIIDTGPGIPEDQIGSIFEEFHQLGNPARSREEGYGLGLAIVQRTARLLGHPLEVATTPGRGSRFSISIPQIEEPAPPATTAVPAAAPTPMPCRCSVLVIEDDPLVAAAMHLALEDLGCTVWGAASAAEALALAGSAAPHMVIADYRLPGGQNGIDAIAAIRTQVGRNLPACVVTGDLAIEVRTRAERIGARYLRKPIQSNDLRTLITEAAGITETAGITEAAGRRAAI